MFISILTCDEQTREASTLTFRQMRFSRKLLLVLSPFRFYSFFSSSLVEQSGPFYNLQFFSMKYFHFYSKNGRDFRARTNDEN